MQARFTMRLSLLSLLFIFSLTSCQQDGKKQVNTEDLIIGRWDIQEAKRNGRITESLDELYYEFYEDGSMRTNLTGASEQCKFELDNKQLYQRESKMDADYLIEELNDSTLVISTELRGSAFQFLLTKSILEE